MSPENFEDVGAVAIGRNEGERLKACLRSLVGRVREVVYVDSGSTDGSVEFARDLGVAVVDLDMSMPFTMARARNSGWRQLLDRNPDLEFVQFVDGDCEVVESWLRVARDTLKSRPEIAVVCGRRRERYPEASRYNRFCDVEWNTPTGEAKACGGDFLVRAEVLRESGGMNETLIAGEEPEWCLRLRKAGFRILRIDEEMTRHDASILKFGPWWKRNRRGGYGALDAWKKCREAFPEEAESELPFDHLIKSSRSWVNRYRILLVAGLAFFPLLLWVLGADLDEALGWGWFLGVGGLAGIVLLQAVRIACNVRDRDPSWGNRLSYGLFTMIGKVPQMIGQRERQRDEQSGRTAQLIEYKGGGGAERKEWEKWKADRARCGASAFFREPSLWAIWIYRFGRANQERSAGPLRWLLDRLYWFGYRTVGTLVGIGLDRLVVVGAGLRIHHYGNVFIHSKVRIGRNCTLRQGVTIGNRHEDGGVPILGDDVEVGAYAQILGEISIGDGAKIGAMSVVLADVPEGYTAVGIPARLIPPQHGEGRENG